MGNEHNPRRNLTVLKLFVLQPLYTEKKYARLPVPMLHVFHWFLRWLSSDIHEIVEALFFTKSNSS